MSKKETPESRKKQIITAAEVVLLAVGIDNFTINLVIKEAEIAKGTVYNYYKHKDEMLAELATKALDMMNEHFKAAMAEHANSIDKIKSICWAAYGFHERHSRHFELISFMERPDFDINMDRYRSLSHDFQQYMSEVIKEGLEKGEIRKDLNPISTIYILWASCVAVVQFVESKKKLLKYHLEISTKTMVDDFANMIAKSLEA